MINIQRQWSSINKYFCPLTQSTLYDDDLVVMGVSQYNRSMNTNVSEMMCSVWATWEWQLWVSNTVMDKSHGLNNMIQKQNNATHWIFSDNTHFLWSRQGQEVFQIKQWLFLFSKCSCGYHYTWNSSYCYSTMVQNNVPDLSNWEASGNVAHNTPVASQQIL